MRNTLAGLFIALGLWAGAAYAQAPAGGQATDRQGGQAGQTGQQPRIGQAGQNQGQANRQDQRTQGQIGQHSPSDQQVAHLISGGCSNEIEIARFAESRLQSDEAREFAQRMVRDHSPGCETMKQIAGNLAHGGQQPAGAGPQGGSLDWAKVHSDIAQQCLASVKQELGQYQGLDFDKAFMGQQVMAHMEMIDKLKVLRNHASPQLQQHLDQELQLAQNHLQRAKQIKEQLKDRPSERVSRRPESK